MDLIADGRDVTAVAPVLGGLAVTCPAELADLRALLADTLAAAGATLPTVLATVQREFLGGTQGQAHPAIGDPGAIWGQL